MSGAVCTILATAATLAFDLFVFCWPRSCMSPSELILSDCLCQGGISAIARQDPGEDK